jgi:hypothetical protein
MLGELNLLELELDCHEDAESTQKPNRIICSTYDTVHIGKNTKYE